MHFFSGVMGGDRGIICMFIYLCVCIGEHQASAIGMHCSPN